MSTINPYAKAIVAAVAAVLVIVMLALDTGPADVIAILGAVFGAVGVYAVPNRGGSSDG